MESLDASEFRDRFSESMERVAAGESFIVQASGRDVARIVPVDRRPRTVPWSALSHATDRVAADKVFSDHLREIPLDTTDEID